MTELPASDPLETLRRSPERRQVTVLFCDIVGSTELASRLDPEDLHELISECLNSCADVVRSFGGFVARYMGDGVLAYFGYPAAAPDAAQQAIRAALSLTMKIPDVGESAGEKLQMRVGIATGLVVVGELGAGGAREMAVSGEAPNFAARLQAAAQPGKVLVSEETHDLAGPRFVFREVANLNLKGLSHRQRAWEVLRESQAGFRGAAEVARRSAPLVGRDEELKALLGEWRSCIGGGGAVVGIVGEPGLGKSRLIRELHRRVARGRPVWLEGACTPAFNNTPFHALSQMVGERRGGAAPRAGSALPRPESADGSPPLAEAGDIDRQQHLARLYQWVAELGARSPTIMVFEDLQWADPSTLEFLTRLIDQGAPERIFVLYTAREEFSLPWRPHSGHHVRHLARLSSEAMDRLVRATAALDLPSGAVRSIVERADGVPLFGEELSRLFAAGHTQPDVARIPNRLNDLLMHRLDALGPAKPVAQMAAVIGANFSSRLLAAMAGASESAADAMLSPLVASGVVAASRSDPETYCFSHAMMRDAAYESILRRHRQRLHHCAASVIVRQFPEIAGGQPEVLAQHWAIAHEPELSARSWKAAARAALARNAYTEAARDFEEAIGVLAEAPPSGARDQLELDLVTGYAGVLQISRGYAAPEASVVVARAARLVTRGDRREQANHVAAMWMSASSAGDYIKASRLADQLLTLAEVDGSMRALGIAHMAQMTSLYRRGRLPEAEHHFLEGRRYFASPEFRRRPGALAQTFGNAAVIAWMFDRPDEARARMDYALTTSVAAPYEIVFAQHMASMIAVLMGDAGAAGTLARRSLDLAVEHGFPQFAAISRIVLGRTIAEGGDPEAGAALMRQGLAAMAAPSSRVGVTMYLTWLGEVLADAGQPAAAMAQLDQALSENPQERFFRPETLRWRALVRRALGDEEGSRSDLRAAAILARRMGATLFHQRAVTALQDFQQRSHPLPRPRRSTRPPR